MAVLEQCSAIPDDNFVGVCSAQEPETAPSPEPESTQPPQSVSKSRDTRNVENTLEVMRTPCGYPPGRVGYSVDLEEYMACDDAQRAAMGTVFYKAPEGYNSLTWHGK